jgi:hypothetical protein
MKKVAFLITTLLCFNLYAQDRWRNIFEDIKWDTKSAIKLDSKKVKFFYEYQFIDEQRQHGIKSGLFNQLQASEIEYGLSGVIINCSTNESGFFKIQFLNSRKIPVIPPHDTQLSQVVMSSISPESVMEYLKIDVCKYFKIK